MATDRRFPGLYFPKRGSSSLNVGWRDPDTGIQHTVSLKKLGYSSKEAAYTWLLEKSQQVRAGREVRERSDPGNKLGAMSNIADVLKSYCEDYGLKHSPKATTALKKNQVPMLEASFRQAGWSECRHITKKSLKAWVKRMEAGSPSTGKELAPNTRNRYRDSMRAFLRYASNADVLRIDEATIIKELKNDKTDPGPPELLTPEQHIQLIRTAMSCDHHRAYVAPGCEPINYQCNRTAKSRYRPWLPLIAMWSLTGTRLSEPLNLRWEDINHHHQMMRIPISKTGIRLVPLKYSPLLRRLLKGLAATARGPYILEGHDPKRPRNFRRESWNTFAATAGMHGTCPGIFRSTAETALRMAENAPGGSIIEKWMGHSTQVAIHHYWGESGIGTGDSMEEWLGIKDDLEKAFDQLGWEP